MFILKLIGLSLCLTLCFSLGLSPSSAQDKNGYTDPLLTNYATPPQANIVTKSESNASGDSGYGYYPYEPNYNQSIYNRWYYRYSDKIVYKKRDFKYRPKQYYRNKYRYKTRYTYKYRGGGQQHYNPRKSHLGRKSTTTPGGFGHRRSIGTRSFSFNR